MSFFDRFRKAKKPLIATSKQPENFYLAAKKYKDRPGCYVRYRHRKQPGGLPVYVQAIPLIDTLEVAKNIESFIGSTWGGGSWQVQIIDGTTNVVLCSYQLSIGGPIYGLP